VEYGDVLFLTISHWTAPDTVRYTIETNGTSVIGCLPLNTMNNEAIKTKIYPNPFVDLLTIETNNNSGYKSLEIWDSVGKKVFEEKMDGFEQVDLNRLKKGLYFLRILNNDQLIFQKKLSKL